MPITHNKTSKVKTIISKILPGFISNEKYIEDIGNIKEHCLIEKLELLKEKEEAKILLKTLELERFVNNFILYVNKEGVLFVVYGKNLIEETTKEVNLECIDIFTQELIIPNGKMIMFSEKKLEALLKLNEQERVLLFFWNDHKIDCEIEIFQKISKKEILNKIEEFKSKKIAN